MILHYEHVFMKFLLILLNFETSVWITHSQAVRQLLFL